MFQLVKRFFEPAVNDKKESFKSFAGTMVNAIYIDILPVIYLPKLILDIQAGDVTKIYQTSIIFLVLVSITFTFRIILRGWYWYSHRKFLADLEKKYRPIVLKKENLYFEKTGTGKAQSIIENGLNTWARTLNDSIWYITRIVVAIVLGVVVISKVNHNLLFLFFGLIILAVYFNYLFRKLKYKIDLEQKDVRNLYNAFSVRSIMSRNEIIYSNKIQEETNKLHNLKLQEHKLGVRSDIYGALSVVPGEMMFLMLPFIGTIIYLYFNYVDFKSENIALLVSFVYFSSRMSGMVWQFMGFMWIVMENFPDIKKFWDFLDNTPEIKNYETGEKFIHTGGDIKLENITFKYDDELVLNNLSLSVAAGTKLALVGRSGSGKTTIAKLIAGYLRSQQGKVLVDGQDLNTVSLKSYYKYIGYLTQEPSVFDGTIKENMLYAVDKKDSASVTEKEIEIALEKAQCDFVFKLKKGMHTEIGEKGVRLSGGERQRLAIAKLFLKNPEIIILDEPTSALDSFSEEKVSKSLQELFKGRTTIIIAHRLQTVRNADRIIVLENGQILEDSTHQDLVEQKGKYYEMLNLQSGLV
jgi:ABC-type multidrug transport system fused ATPase/permease subunit